MELIAMSLLCTLESPLSIRKNITYEIIMQENQISQVFRNLPVCERHYNHVLTEENIVSCSRAFRKPKNAEDERKLIENSTPKSTSAVKKWSLKNKNPVLSVTYSQLASLECNAWTRLLPILPRSH